jgi:transcriptional regulator with XRE-family HTH domain
MDVITNEQAKRNVAANVLWHLERLGWSQADLSEASGESVMQISRICRGVVLANAAALARIAEALGTSVDKLLESPKQRPEKNRELVRQSA